MTDNRISVGQLEPGSGTRMLGRMLEVWLSLTARLRRTRIIRQWHDLSDAALKDIGLNRAELCAFSRSHPLRPGRHS
jgi:uncharacterized protein YjiS (DUF1127 family)